MTKLYLRRVRAKAKTREPYGFREVTTRASQRDEAGQIIREYLPCSKEAIVRLRVDLAVSGKPEFTKEELIRKVSEILKEIEI